MYKKLFIIRLYELYADAIRTSPLTRSLLLFIAIKLFIMFAIIKALFFPNILNKLDSDELRAKTVVENLISKSEKQ